ncbi:MAG TPA: class A beta-lactamase [Steroidobacteraceae bacterium]|jgi:beta-lactamase class A|nr:class A beta-lactamase [Steroidobacteraceae bacterium]
MLTRREILIASAAVAIAPDASAAMGAERALKQIHERIGGRLGVHVLDSQSGRRIGFDDNSRYAMASTFKLPLVAALLWQVDRKAFSLERGMPIAKSALVAHSPAVEAKLATGADSMSVRELCAAAMTLSDNTAANILLSGIGGPQGLTAFLRTLGDTASRLDRSEPELNSNLAGDPRDTTTPRAIVNSMLKLFTQGVLSLPSRALLIDWMAAASTGLERVRAGIPKSWNPGDKTGGGDNGASNDLVIAYPPGRRPIFIAVYMSESKLSVAELNAAHAEIGGIVANERWK